MDIELSLWQVSRSILNEPISKTQVLLLEQILMRLTLSPRIGILSHRSSEIKNSVSKMRHLVLSLLEKTPNQKLLGHLKLQANDLRKLIIQELLLSLDNLSKKMATLTLANNPLNHGSLQSAHNSLTFVGTLAALNKQFLTLAALGDIFMEEALTDTADVLPLIPKIVQILGFLIDQKSKLPEFSPVPHQDLMHELMGKLKQSYELKVLRKAFKRVS